MLGFFSFTEVTDPSAHRAYNEWHQMDHMPEQFSIEGVTFGQRWVCTPRCVEARVSVSPLLEPCQYMTLYLMRDAGVIPEFKALAARLWKEDRFFAARHSHLNGPFEVRQRWAASRVRVSPDAVPFRPARGVYIVVGPMVDGAAMAEQGEVAGAWQFADGVTGRHITVAFVDGDLYRATADLSDLSLGAGSTPEWAGPLETIDASQWGWFDKLSPQ